MTPLARTTDPATSHQAAQSLTNLGHQQAMALQAIARASRVTGTGATVSQAAVMHPAERTPQLANLGRRITDLRELGLVYDTGRTRMADTGRNQTVWELTDAGRQRVQAAAA